MTAWTNPGPYGVGPYEDADAMDPCRYCGSTDPTHHVYGERKCCPDCDHRPPPSYEETLDRTLRLLARARRCLDYLAEESKQSRDAKFREMDGAVAKEIAFEIVQLIGHPVTDQPEADEMFALREFLGEVSDPKTNHCTCADPDGPTVCRWCRT